MSLLRSLDVFFLLFHSLWILFAVLGWIWSRTRRFSLAALALTAVSWFGLGYWRGWGYCICTDWHWQVRRSLGDFDLPNNYIGFLIREGTGLEIPDPVLGPVIVGIFVVSVAGGIGLSLRERSRTLKTAARKPPFPAGGKKAAAPGRRQESRRSRPATRESPVPDGDKKVAAPRRRQESRSVLTEEQEDLLG